MGWPDTEQKVHVLFIDDKQAWRIQANIFIEKGNPLWNVNTAGSATKALEMLEENEYDAIVSDYKMPGMDGLEFLETLRKQGSTIPFIIFTGKGREKVAMRALNLGADHYLRKGGDPESQYKLLTQAIQKEIKLNRKEAQFQKLFNSLPDPVVVHDIKGHISTVNQPAREKFGNSQKQLRDQLQAIFKEKLKKLEKKEHITHEVTFPQDENLHSLELTSTLVRNHGKDRIISIIRDITELKKVKKERKELQSLLTSFTRIKQIFADEIPWKEAMKTSSKILLETRGYKGVYIAIQNEEGMITPLISQGEIELGNWEVEPSGNGHAPQCVKEALQSDSLHLVDHPETFRKECSFHGKKDPYKVVVIPLKSINSIIGVLTICIEPNRSLKETELDILQSLGTELSTIY